MDMLEVPLILFLVIVAPIWIIAHYTTRWRMAKSLSPEDEKQFAELWQIAERMEQRIDSIERILDAEEPQGEKLTFLSALFFTMPAVFGYFIAALVLKRRPEHLYASREEEVFWRSVRLEPSRTAHDLLRKFQELERRLRAAEAKVTSSEFRLRRQFKDLEG
jgi:phage shock protein B